MKLMRQELVRVLRFDFPAIGYIGNRDS